MMSDEPPPFPFTSLYSLNKYFLMKSAEFRPPPSSFLSSQEVDQRANGKWVSCQWRNLEAEMRSTLIAHQTQQQRAHQAQQQQQQVQSQGGKDASATRPAAATATDAVGPDGWRLRLRAPVQHLRELWGRRLQVGKRGGSSLVISFPASVSDPQCGHLVYPPLPPSCLSSACHPQNRKLFQ